MRVLLLVAVAGLALLGWTWWLVAHDAHPAMDREAFDLLGGHRGDLLARHARQLDTLATLALAGASLLVVVLLAIQKRLREIFTIACGYVLAFLAAEAIKRIEQRPRPRGGLLPAKGYSFPSTDAALSIGLIAIAVGLALLSRRRSQRSAAVIVGCLGSVIAGVVLIALRVHYLTDVLGGWGVGIASFAACDVIVGTLTKARMAVGGYHRPSEVGAAAATHSEEG